MLTEHHLNRFEEAQEHIYSRVVSELKNGYKQSHWMWFIFPQIEGLGQSMTSRRYSIKSLEEAKAYFLHPVLGKRLVECSTILLGLAKKTATEIFGYPDNMKLQSCMTLFAVAAPEEPVFDKVLLKYFKNTKDLHTLDIIRKKR